MMIGLNMNYKDSYIEERETPKDHTRRLAKVTLYLDVPSIYSEETLERTIERKISELDINTTSPSETMISEPGSDNPANFVNPVGFIAPDGEFYLVEGDTDDLAHLHLAPFVEKLYKPKLQYSGMSLDYDLEKAGFVKVHGVNIRYFAHAIIGKDTYTPNLTESQLQSIVRYGKLHNWEGDIFVNDKRIPVTKIAQADQLSLRKIFEL